jgi:hypothetical protein
MIFYGGQGGGNKKKSSILEVGFMLAVEVKKSKGNTDSYQAKEWSLVWGHRYVRENHTAYYTLCFFLELVAKIAPQDDLKDDFRKDDDSSEGIFRVLSNALFYMDQSTKDKSFNQHWHILVCLSKMSYELGIFPQRELCFYTDHPLDGTQNIVLIPEHGSFALSEHVKDHHFSRAEVEQGQLLWRHLDQIQTHKYGQAEESEVSPPVSRSLFLYVCFQFSLNDHSFKTSKMVWY